MDLDYNVAWIENDITSYNVKKNIVESVIIDLGFNFPSPLYLKGDEDISSISFDSYDLIIADFKLDNGRKGTDLLHRIRDRSIYTEVLFYSSEGEDIIREELKNSQVDGAYCISRDNDSFRVDVENIIRTLVRKVFDINNMRGLLMSSAADLDIKMESILIHFFKKYPDRVSFLNQKKKGVSDNMMSRADALLLIEDESLFAHRDFTSKNKCDSISSLIKLIQDSESKRCCKNIHREFYNEIIDPRNNFAHVSCDGSGRRVLIVDGIVYDEAACIEILKKIKLHASNLDSIHSLVKDQFGDI